MSSKSVARCIVCREEMNFEINEALYLLSDDIYYCDECLEAITKASYGSFAFWDNPTDAEYDRM